MRDPEGTRRRVLTAATAAFARSGFEGARVDAIAARARLTAEERFSWTAIAARAHESYMALKAATATRSGSV